VEDAAVDDTRAPTGRELEILKFLWDHGPSSVRTVYRRLLDQQPAGKDLAYNTVQTLLRLMETKSLVRSRTEGRAFVYSPLYSREQTAARFLDRVFDGAASQLVASLLQAERISPAELERMQGLIAEARRKRTGR
jgi:BlaI family transcriptional regulator, penicillinase repressor